MGVEFDWQADGADGQRETIAQTPRRFKFKLPGWVRRAATILLVGTAAVTIVSYAFLRLRYERLSREAETQIQDVMELEAQALSRQDVGLFMEHQDEASPDWYAQQAKRVQGEAPAVPPAAIQDLELRGDVAWVEVVEGETAERRARFYRRTASGWVHTAPRIEFWGPLEEVRSGELIVRYHQRDQPHIDPLLVYLDKVASEVSADLRYVTSASKLVVYFAPDLIGCGSCLDAESPPPSITRITLPSPWLSGIPSDGPWEEDYLDSLRHGVTYALASNAMREDNQPRPNPLQKALADEYAAWYSHGQDGAQAPLLGRILERHGRDALPRVFLSLKGAHLSTLFVVRWLSLNPSADPIAYFELLLNVEREAILAGRKDTFTLFQDPGWLEEQERFYDRARSYARPLLLPTVHVEEVERDGDHVLVTLRKPIPLLQGLRTTELVEYETMSSGGSPSFGALAQRPVGPYAFYRRREGDWEWKRASRTEAAFWGIPSIRTSSSHAVGELDALGGGD